MDGRIDLRPDLSLSAMNLGVRFKLTDAYRAKSVFARPPVCLPDRRGGAAPGAMGGAGMP